MATHSKTLRLTACSDLVISARHGTEGGHTSLDYIPGSALLGVAVGAWLRSGNRFEADLFLSGKLRFNNAYPCGADEGARLHATIPTPLAFHHPKEDKRRVFNGVLKSLDPKNNPLEPQLKQMRKGFIDLTLESQQSLSFVTAKHTSRMKTAIDRGGYGRSKESHLFDYQAIQAGQSFLCPVEADERMDSAVFSKLIELLCGGRIRIGRSRSAEFGSVEVEALPGTEPSVSTHPKDGCVVLYLASDLVLLRDGNPVLLPNAGDFGLQDDCVLDLKRTFIRTRAYSPWIHYRDGYDIERQSITQGSVLTFRTAGNDSVSIDGIRERFASGWGLHRNEGCGRLLVNPAFLFDFETIAVAENHKVKSGTSNHEKTREMPPPPSELTRLLMDRHESKNLTLKAEPIAKGWEKTLISMMKKVADEVGEAPGKTQWSTVRSIAASGDEPEKVHASLEKYFSKSRRESMWSEVVSYNEPDRDQRGRRLSLADFLLGVPKSNPPKSNEPQKMVWEEEWFRDKTPFVRDERRGHCWALLVALTATHVIRNMNRAESPKQKEATHV